MSRQQVPIKNLLRCCKNDIEWFARFGDTTDTIDGPLTLQDNGASILGVAHLDSVMFSKPKLDTNKKSPSIQCPQLDDRLGAWVLLHVLPSLGVKCDVLLTDSEECGRSTARHFEPPKDYNWIFSFDRAGRDVVMYDYESDETLDLLSGHGLSVGWGSFSDICFLEHMGVTGFNFGVGYHLQHTAKCYANLRHTLEMAGKFATFARDHQDTPMPWTPTDYYGKDIWQWEDADAERECNQLSLLDEQTYWERQVQKFFDAPWGEERDAANYDRQFDEYIR